LSAEAATPLKDILEENWDRFAGLKLQAENGLKLLSRELPPDFYETLREELLRLFFRTKSGAKLKVRLVVDANIIIRDAFRVAKGLLSTTERFLSSSFVEMIAPPNIVQEVDNEIRRDLPHGASLETALSHAKSLLAKVRLTEAKYEAYQSAMDLIWSRVGKKSPSDVYFLGLAIETEADALLSGDKKAFEGLPHTRRWETGKAVQVMQTYETGTLTIFLAGVGFELSFKMFQRLVVLSLTALEDAAQVMASLVGLLAKGSLEALSSLPSWSFAIILGAVGAILILALINKEFRDAFQGVLTKVIDGVNGLVHALFGSLEYFWAALRTILILIWNFAAPTVVPPLIIIAGVACEAISRLLKQANGDFRTFESESDPKLTK